MNQSNLYYNLVSNNSNNKNYSFYMVNNNFINLSLSNILTGFILYSLTIWTIIGNIFVCVAILTNHKLKQGGMSNFLIGNLALSDLLLGMTVLPFSASLTTFKTWLFGKILCDLWLSIDVLCSTASIWGLLVIAFDRYIATNHPVRYRKQKKSIKIAISYCTISWLISIIISLGPVFFNFNSSQSELKSGLRKLYNNNTIQYDCVLFQTPSYVIISSLFSFYLPLVLMFILYLLVFLRIREQSKLLYKNKSNKEKSTRKQSKIILENLKNKSIQNNRNNTKNHLQKLKRSQSILPGGSNSEAKITKTLAIIMGAFVACYLPFFTIYIIRSQLNDPNKISNHTMEIFLWLGYFNSALNPILYAILNQNFRNAFSDILACRCFVSDRKRRKNRAYSTINNHTTIKRV